MSSNAPHAGRFKLPITLLVTVGLLDDDVALEQEAVQHLLHIEFGVFGVLHAEGDVLKITEQHHVLGLWFFGHGSVFRWFAYSTLA
jgi:hypothetical protein